jgi:hypothetical protein
VAFVRDAASLSAASVSASAAQQYARSPGLTATGISGWSEVERMTSPSGYRNHARYQYAGAHMCKRGGDVMLGHQITHTLRGKAIRQHGILAASGVLAYFLTGSAL